MTMVKQSSYHLLMTLAAIIGVTGTAAVFFFGVGYLNLILLFLTMFISYFAITLTLGYAISHFYQPTRHQVLITHIVMSVFAVIGGLVLGKLLVG